MAKVDPRTFIASVDRDELTAQIAAAKADLDKLQGEYKALLSLAKMIDWRDGKKIRNRRKKSTDTEGAPAADPAPQEEDESLADSIEGVLGRASGPLSELSIAKGVDEQLPKVKAVLRAFTDRFAQASIGHWKLADDEGGE